MLSIGYCFIAVETTGSNDECANTFSENTLWAAATARYVVSARLVKSSVASSSSCSLASPLMAFATTFFNGIPGMSSGHDACGCKSLHFILCNIFVRQDFILVTTSSTVLQHDAATEKISEGTYIALPCKCKDYR